MTITRTLLNEGAGTPEDLTITPFVRASWIATDVMPEDKVDNAVAARRYVLPGSDAKHPLVRVNALKNTTARYSGDVALAQKGLRHEVTVSTVVENADSLSGITSYTPCGVQLAFFHGGNVMDDPEGMLDLMASAVACLYLSVTTGDPETTVVTGVANGNTSF
jgi:hypothetical protein